MLPKKDVSLYTLSEWLDEVRTWHALVVCICFSNISPTHSNTVGHRPCVSLMMEFSPNCIRVSARHSVFDLVVDCDTRLQAHVYIY